MSSRVPLLLGRIRLVVPERVLTRAIEQTLVVLDLDSGRSFALDPIGSRAWTLLTTAPTALAAYETLLAEYEADPAGLRADVEALVETLVARSLVIVESIAAPDGQ